MEKRCLTGTTTHRADGMQIDAWAGEYIDASDNDEAIWVTAEWTKYCLEQDGAEDIEIDGDTVSYVQDGEDFFIKVTADEEKGEAR